MVDVKQVTHSSWRSVEIVTCAPLATLCILSRGDAHHFNPYQIQARCTSSYVERESGTVRKKEDPLIYRK
jgi:hypothetical protein